MANETPKQIMDPIFDRNEPAASLDALNGIQLVHEDLLSGFVRGNTESIRKGQGVRKAGVREYTPGDNPRHIDWKATAHSAGDELIVREHVADITPSLWVVSDIADRRYTNNPGYFSEQSLGLSAMAAFCLVANRQRMPIGLVSASRTETFMSDRLSRHRDGAIDLLRLISLAVEETPAPQPKKGLFHGRKKTSSVEESTVNSQPLAAAMQRAGDVCMRNLVIVVSDFRESLGDQGRNSWIDGMKHLQENKNDVLAVELTNVWDFHLPDTVTRFRNQEGEVLYLEGRDGDKIRQAYAEKSGEQAEHIAQVLRESEAAHIRLDTSDPKWATSIHNQMQHIAGQ